MKVVSTNRKDWSIHLRDALWAYQTTCKTILGMSPYKVFYGKACHLPIEVEYKVWWIVKKLINYDLHQAKLKRMVDLSELEKIRNVAYINSSIAEAKNKKWHYQFISRKELHIGQNVLLYDSKPHMEAQV